LRRIYKLTIYFGRFSARLKRPETRRNKRTSPLKSLG
jgi:hypothetical protein